MPHIGRECNGCSRRRKTRWPAGKTDNVAVTRAWELSAAKKLSVSREAGLEVAGGESNAHRDSDGNGDIRRGAGDSVAARNNAANAGDHYGWRRGDAAFSPNEGSFETGGATGRQISTGGYPDQQLPELGIALDLCADAVQHDVAPSPYPGELQVRQFLAQFC